MAPIGNNNNVGVKDDRVVAREVQAPPSYPYSRFLPDFSESTISESFPRLQPYTHSDPGLRALELPKEDQAAFLKTAQSVKALTPHSGSEVTGVDLTSLTDADKDQLALFVARRKVVVFRDQTNFLKGDPDSFREWGRYFGRLHVHPTSAHPKDAPELHLVYRDANTSFNFELSGRTSSVVWHSDVSYELQPPGLTTLVLLASRK